MTARRRSGFVSTACLLYLAIPTFAQDGPTPALVLDRLAPVAGSEAHQAQVHQALPTQFVENRGQWTNQIRFAAHVGPLQVRLEPAAILVQALSWADGEAHGQVTSLRFDGALKEAVLVGENQLATRYHFLHGDAEPIHSVGFTSVLYQRLYEGVDLRVREVEGQLEYDLLLAPGADIADVRITCEGPRSLEETEDGGLLLHTDAGVLSQSAPITWSVLPDGSHKALECRAVVLGERVFGFRLADHDPSLSVVIDPGLSWSTYLGGSSRDNMGAVEVDPQGRAIVAGRSMSADFPITSGTSLNGTEDAVVACLDPSLSGAAQLVWATFVGGAKEDIILDLQVGVTGRIFAAGMTHSTNFPTPGGYQTTYGGGLWDGFLLELASDGSSVVYGSYLGGQNFDYAMEVELTEPAVLTVGGITKSSSFPSSPNAFEPNKIGGRDYFFGRLDLNSPGQEYLSFLGTTGDEGFELNDAFPFGNNAIGVASGPAGEIYLIGVTGTLSWPTTPNAWRTISKGLDMALVVIDPTMAGQAGLVYGTYLGGSSGDGPGSMVVDAQGVATIGGYTYSNDFPVTSGAYQESFIGPAGFNDATLTRFDYTQANPPDQVVYATYLGGQGYESFYDLRALSDGAFVGTGFTGTGGLVGNTFPVTCDNGPVRARDGFVVVLSPDGNGRSDLHYGALFGGTTWDVMMSVAVSSESPLGVFVTGSTDSLDFPVDNPYQGAYQGGATDGVVFGGILNGRNYCVAAPNSHSSDGSFLCGLGSTSVAANSFVLEATGSVPNNPGMFFYGQGTISAPAGDGILCVGGGPQYRLLPPAFADAFGTASFAVDFNNLPVGGDILGGSTWYFQWWYRDPAGGPAGYNFSNGLEMTFSN